MPWARTADALANEIARRVDEILGMKHTTAAEPVVESEVITASCSCGLGIPVMRLKIAGKEREIVALPLILEGSRKNGKSAEQVFDAVKVYNAIPAELESAYRDAIIRAYSAFIAPLEKQEV